MGFFKGEKQKPRRLILTENALQCEQVSSKKTRKVKKSIMLVDVKVVEALNSIVNAFQVACYDKDGWNTLYMICDNAGQRNDWIKLIRDASKKCGAHVQAKYHPDVYDRHKKKYKCCQGDRKSDGCQNTHSDESTYGLGM
ncbi:hypothetical protein LSAT2_004399 [Lamellibrachia satsuma]|nr:hypothetical protein LSAT2_004399 [Lamellibrachia satsuma]